MRFKNFHCTTLKQKIAQFLFFSRKLLCLLFMQNFNTAVNVKYLLQSFRHCRYIYFSRYWTTNIAFCSNCNFQHCITVCRDNCQLSQVTNFTGFSHLSCMCTRCGDRSITCSISRCLAYRCFGNTYTTDEWYYFEHLISHMSVCHFLHHQCHHPLLLLSFTPGSKLIFSTNPFLHSSSTFPPTGLTPLTPAGFSFFCGISVLTLALCARLSWLPVSC